MDTLTIHQDGRKRTKKIKKKTDKQEKMQKAWALLDAQDADSASIECVYEKDNILGIPAFFAISVII